MKQELFEYCKENGSTVSYCIPRKYLQCEICGKWADAEKTHVIAIDITRQIICEECKHKIKEYCRRVKENGAKNRK